MIGAVHQRDHLFEHRHHAEPQQIDFDDAQIGAIFFVPLDHDAARHGGGLERHDRIELALADHHAAGVLAQMARQVLHGDIQLEEFANAAVARIETGFVELALGGVARILPLPSARQARQARHCGLIEAQRFADFARGRASAIGDDVGGHGGAEFAIALVDILDDALAPIAAGQVDIDVGPFAALLGEEALEEQLHADRVDRRDAERIADRAVGGRAAPLRQNALLAAEFDDVPDDEEVAGSLSFSMSASSRSIWRRARS